MRSVDYVIITTGLVVAAVAVALAVTLVTGSFCHSSHCSSREPTVIGDQVYTADSYGWPLAWKKDLQPSLVEELTHPAYGFDSDGVSYKMFGISAGINFVLAAGAELLLLGAWRLWTTRVTIGLANAPPRAL